MYHQNHRIFITRKLPIDLIKKIENNGIDYEMWPSDQSIPRDVLIDKVKNSSGILCLLTDKIDEEIVKLTDGKLKVVSTMSVGYDHVDLNCLKKHNIKLGFTPDVLTDATAELTLALLLATSRNLPTGIESVKNGKWGQWEPFWLCGSGLSKSTVGIVGMGRIGRAVAKRIAAFNVKEILYYNRSGQTGDTMNISDSSFIIPPAYWRPFEDLLTQSDFVIVCCSSNADSKHLFNRKTFNLMKSSGIFINTSRGSVVNQDDLYDALTSGVIRAAGLDVTDPEPLPPSHKLLTLDNCVILPHIGSATLDTRRTMTELAVDNVIAGVLNEPLPCEVKL